VPWHFYFGQLATLAIFIPMCVLAWCMTGGPNGGHGATFWPTAAAFGAVAVVLAGRLPPPWNGRGRDEPQSRPERVRDEDEARRLLAERGSQLDAERVEDVRLLHDTGFAREAAELLRAETNSPSSDPPGGRRSDMM
jgi:hypothetical protein